MGFRNWICHVYDNLCALEQSLNYEQPKGSEDTEDSNSSTTNDKVLQQISSDDYTESYTYESEVIKSPPRRREKNVGQRRRELRKSALLQSRSTTTPRYKETERSKASKERDRAPVDDPVPEVIVTSSTSIENKSFQKHSSDHVHMETEHPGNIQEVLIPVGSMVPVAVDEKDSGSISTSDSFSALRQKWKLGLKSKMSKSIPEEEKGAKAKDNPQKDNPDAKANPKSSTPQSSTFPHDAKTIRNDDVIGFHQSHGNLQVPHRHAGYSSDSANYMPSRFWVPGHAPRGKQRGYESDISNNVSYNAGYHRQFQEMIHAPMVKQRRSNSSSSYNFAPSGSSDNDRIKANTHYPHGRQQRSYSTDTSNYTPSGSSDADHTRQDRSRRTTTAKLGKNHNSKMKPKFAFMRRKKGQGIKNVQRSGSGTFVGLSSHYGQSSMQPGATQHPHPYMVQMTQPSSHDQQSIPPPLSKVYVKGVSPLRHAPVSQQMVPNTFYMPGHPVQRSVKDEKRLEKSYGFI